MSLRSTFSVHAPTIGFAGLAVVVVSTDFEEVAHICHRALVFSHNRIVRELAGDALTTAALIHAASVSEAA